MLEIGLCAEEITPGESVPLFGYGDRTHDSEGIHDPLYACAWWLRPQGGEPFLWLVLDLCVLSPGAARAVADGVRQSLGEPALSAERVVVSTTHTHSGPDTWDIARDNRPWARRYYRRLLEQSAAAARRARDTAVPGFLELRLGQGSLGANRRDAGLPTDPRITVLSARDAGGRLLGVVFHYSCHLTVLGVENYRISADWLGPARTRLQEALGVAVVFLQGAEGNIDPASRGVLDMADPDQARGASFAVLEALGAKLADDVLAALRLPAALRLERLEVRALEAGLPLRYGPLSGEAVREKLLGWKRSLAEFLGTAEDDVPEDSSINARVKERCRELGAPPAEVRRWVALQFAYTAFLHLTAGGSRQEAIREGTLPVEARLLDFGGLVILTVPAEVLVEAALKWQEQVPGRVALLAGLADGWLGYLPHESNFAEPEAAVRYETVSTQFAPEAAGLLLDGASALLSEAGPVVDAGPRAAPRE